MLVLTRKVGEQIVVPQCRLTVTILDAAPGRVRLGITAPPELVVHRSEVYDRINADLSRDSGGGTLMTVRVLLADRDQYLLATYREHLCQQGAAVATATTGVECLQRLRDFAPDVLVLDPTLPWGGGEGVLAVLDQEPAIRPAFILLLSQGADRGLLYRISTFAVDDFQSKPISPRRLLDRIRSLHASTGASLMPDFDSNCSVRLPVVPR